MNEQKDTTSQPTGQIPSAKDPAGPSASRAPRPQTTAGHQRPTDGGTAQEKVEQAKESARKVGDQVSREAGKVAEKAKEQGLTFLNEQKGRVASEIGAYSEAARRAADRLKAESDTNLSSYVASAAEQLDRLGKRIENQSLGDLVDNVEDIARQRPEIFYGGLFVAGLAAARFLKASKRQRRPDQNGERQTTSYSSGTRPAMSGGADWGARRSQTVGRPSPAPYRPPATSAGPLSTSHQPTTEETSNG